MKFLLLFALLQPTLPPVRLVYSYDTTLYKGLYAEVYRICKGGSTAAYKLGHQLRYDCDPPRKLIWYNEVKISPNKNTTQIGPLDSVIVLNTRLNETYEVHLTAIKPFHVCTTAIDIIEYPYYRISYGLNFSCARLTP